MPTKKRKHNRHRKPQTSQPKLNTPPLAVQAVPTSGVKDTPTQGAQATPTSGVKDTPTQGTQATPTSGVKNPPTQGAQATPTVQVSSVKPADVQKSESKTAAASAPHSKSPAPPADKKAKVEKKSESKTAAASAPHSTSPAHPADKKAKAAPPQSSSQLPAGSRSKEESGSMSLDALEALGDTLGAAEPTPEPPKLRPEDIVKEKELESEKGVRVGEREDTLPPEYRLKGETVAVQPVPVKQPSMDTGEALDLLSGDFTSSAAAPVVHTCPVPPAASDRQKSESKTAAASAPHSKSPAPPADKKAKVEKKSESKTAAASAPHSTSPAHPADKKAKAAPPQSSSQLPAGSRSKEESGSMSLDALEALGDTLGAAEPTPEPPKLRPEDIVKEKELESEKGVRVGEREDTLPPEYRLKGETVAVQPVPVKQPSMDTGEALDLLSGDFTSSAAAPVVHTCPVPPAASDRQPSLDFDLDTLVGETVTPAVQTVSAPPCSTETKQQKSESKTAAASAPHSKSPAPPADKKAKVEKKSESKTAAASAPHSTSPAHPADKKAKAAPPQSSSQLPAGSRSKEESGSMSLDALEALGDTLGAAEPTPEPPKLRPEDIVKEKELESEKGVRVGEREDTLPPEYRLKGETVAVQPVPVKQPSMDTGEALDLLSGDFTSSAAAPVVHTCPVPPAASDRQPSLDFDLDTLVGETVTPAVQTAVTHPVQAARQLSTGTSSALDALCSTLGDATPAQQPQPVPAKDIVKEKQVVEEKLIKTGERDDSLPPEYRPSEKDLQAKKELKSSVDTKQKTQMDDTAALHLMAADFTSQPDADKAMQSPTSLRSAAAPTPPSSQQAERRAQDKHPALVPASPAKKSSKS